jgi:hypothetical protein
MIHSLSHIFNAAVSQNTPLLSFQSFGSLFDSLLTFDGQPRTRSFPALPESNRVCDNKDSQDWLTSNRIICPQPLKIAMPGMADYSQSFDGRILHSIPWQSRPSAPQFPKHLKGCSNWHKCGECFQIRTLSIYTRHCFSNPTDRLTDDHHFPRSDLDELLKVHTVMML